jgi:MFS family permease
VLVTAGVSGLVLGVVRGNAAGWNSASVVSTLAIGSVLVVAFVLFELRQPVPMLQMRLFRLRGFSAGNMANFGVFASMYAFLFFVSQYIQSVLGNGPLGGGLRLIPLTATLMVAAPIAGALADRIEERLIAVVGMAFQTVGVGWLALIASSSLAYSQMVVPLILAGLGASMAMPAAQRAVVGAVRREEIGQASGAVTTVRILGGVFGIAIATAVFSGFGGYASRATFTNGFVAAMAVSAALSLAGTLAALALPGRRPGLEVPSASRRATSESQAES